MTIAQGDDGHELLLGGVRQQVRLGDLGEGHAGINLNAQEKVSDVDVRLNLEPDIDSGGPYVLVRAGGGSDKVDAGGGREFTGPWGRFFDTPYDDSFLAIFGGDGRDVLRGGQGMDYIFGGPQPDTIFTARGPDYVIAQGGGRDEIDCGLGPDRAFVDRLDETSRCRRRENKLRSASSATTASDAGHAPTGRFGVARRLSSTLGRG